MMCANVWGAACPKLMQLQEDHHCPDAFYERLCQVPDFRCYQLRCQRWLRHNCTRTQNPGQAAPTGHGPFSVYGKSVLRWETNLDPHSFYLHMQVGFKVTQTRRYLYDSIKHMLLPCNIKVEALSCDECCELRSVMIFWNSSKFGDTGPAIRKDAWRIP